MDLTTELLQPFIGGQLEIQKPEDGLLHRGQIKTAVVADGEVTVTWDWLAKGEGYPPLPKKWVVYEPRPWSTELLFSNVSDRSDGRIVINSVLGEICVFFPKDGSRIDPANVEGLTLPV